MPRPEGRAGWPVLVAFLAVSAGGAYLALRTHPSDADAVDPSDPMPGMRSVDAPGEAARRHRSFAEDAVPALTGPAAADPGGADRVYDPQRWRMLRSFAIPRGDAGVALPFEMVELAAEIAASSGESGVADDAACALRVLPVHVRDASFNCLVRVMCAGHVIYPNPAQTAGYVDCVVTGGRVVRAEDRGNTAADGDPLLLLDLENGTVTVEDGGDGVERFSLSLRVQR